MFSLLDLADAKNTIFSDRGELVYTPNTSEVSFDLSQLQPTDRGRAIEHMISKRMNLQGIDAEHIGGTNSFDIKLYVNGRIVRGEVKSSLLGPQSKKYYFQGVKPNECDVIFFAFVHPTKGIIVKTCGVQAIRQWIAEYNPTEKEHGYDIYFNETTENAKLPTIEWNPTGEGVAV